MPAVAPGCARNSLRTTPEMLELVTSVKLGELGPNNYDVVTDRFPCCIAVLFGYGVLAAAPRRGSRGKGWNSRD